ncbi:phage scaffolding protein [Salinicoccus jeotgali]|uniref:phage scaffolding protein n=1 Tax=Salinicoccus jeotgali TaxID=381634 RepID=UPI0031D98D45
MKRQFLRDLGVDEEHIPKIIDEHHDTVREYKESASKADDLQSQLDTANEEITERDNQIEQLKNSTDNEELQKKLNEYETSNADYENKLKQVQLDSAIKLAVAKEANDPSDVLAFIDKDGLEVAEDGTIKGLDDKLSTLKENKPYLFQAQKKTGRTPQEGGPAPSITKEDFDKMSYTEKNDLYNNNKQLYDEFTK